jgi:hypothetical protein
LNIKQISATAALLFNDELLKEIASSPNFIGILAMTVDYTQVGLTPLPDSEKQEGHCEPDEGGRGNL